MKPTSYLTQPRTGDENVHMKTGSFLVTKELHGPWCPLPSIVVAWARLLLAQVPLGQFKPGKNPEALTEDFERQRILSVFAEDLVMW